MKREIWLGERCGAQRGSLFFLPQLLHSRCECLFLDWQQGEHCDTALGGQTHRRSGSASFCNIKPSTHFKAACRHPREFPTRCNASQRLGKHCLFLICVSFDGRPPRLSQRTPPRNFTKKNVTYTAVWAETTEASPHVKQPPPDLGRTSGVNTYSPPSMFSICSLWHAISPHLFFKSSAT